MEKGDTDAVDLVWPLKKTESRTEDYLDQSSAKESDLKQKSVSLGQGIGNI